MVPALEADLVQNLRTVYGVVALGAIIVGPERRVVRVLEPLVRVDKLAHLMVAHACVDHTMNRHSSTANEQCK